MSSELVGKDQRTDQHRDASMGVCYILPGKEGAHTHTHTGEAFFRQLEKVSVTDPSSCLGFSQPAGRTA